MTANPTGRDGDGALHGARSEGASALLAAAAAPSTQDALALLRSDHQRVETMLADCERMVASGHASPADRSAMVSRLGALLIAHAQMEQQLFYPVLGMAAGELERARAEHAAIETALQDLSDPADGGVVSVFGERIAALARQVREHVREEEAHFFPRALSSGIDLHELGSQMSVRRAQLLGDQGID